MLVIYDDDVQWLRDNYHLFLEMYEAYDKIDNHFFPHPATVEEFIALDDYVDAVHILDAFTTHWCFDEDYNFTDLGYAAELVLDRIVYFNDVD